MRPRFIGDHIRSAPALDDSYVQRGWPNPLDGRQPDRPEATQRFQEFVNRGFAEFRISRMRHSPRGADFYPQRPFRCRCYLVFRRLAVDQKLATRRLLIRNLRAQAVLFLSHNEEQPNINTFLPQPLRSRYLRGDDPLRIASPAPINPGFIFRRRKERRNRIHVRGEDNLRSRLLRRSRKHIAALAFDWHLAGAIAEAAEFAVNEIPRPTFISGG